MSDTYDDPPEDDLPDDDGDEPDDDDGALDLGYDGPLPELRAMVSIFSEPESGIGVTLQVGGFMISGQSVPRATWLRALAGREKPAEVITHEDGVVWGLHEVATEAALEADVDGGVPSGKVEEIYLVDVLVESAVKRWAFRAYQVQLSAIDAWSLGQTASPD